MDAVFVAPVSVLGGVDGQLDLFRDVVYAPQFGQRVRVAGVVGADGVVAFDEAYITSRHVCALRWVQIELDELRADGVSLHDSISASLLVHAEEHGFIVDLETGEVLPFCD